MPGTSIVCISDLYSGFILSDDRGDPRGSLPVAEPGGVPPARTAGRISLSDDPAGIRAGEDVPAVLDRLDPLGVLPEGHAGHLEDVGLLLDTAGVGQDRPGAGKEGEHIEVGERLDELNVCRRRDTVLRKLQASIPAQGTVSGSTPVFATATSRGTRAQ